jgi:hypothetical protein
MARCLFTDEELDEGTREEHTIQRSIGGRIRSREVSSNAFNGRCGGLIDSIFGDLYWDTMSVLGPAIPEASRRGDRFVRVPSQPGTYVIDKFGAIGLRGTAVISREPTTNRPTGLLASDEAAMQRVIAKNMLPGATGRPGTTLPPSLNVSLPGRPVMCAEIEVAALKAALLTFDHLLREHSDRFTRSLALEQVRTFIRRAVMERATPDAYQLGQLVLGLQYDADYTDLYQNLRGDVAFPASPFEHVVLMSANAPTRTVDVVFWVFRSDPYAFRVCQDWQGDSYTYVAVNGVLSGTTFSQAVRLDDGHLLGRATRWRSYRYVTPSSRPDDGARMRDELFARRSDLYRRAVDFAERHFDEIVIARLQDLAALNGGGDHRVKTAVVDRLRIAFNNRIQSDESGALFDRMVGEVLREAPDDTFLARPHGEVAGAIDWERWLERYRRCLDALRGPLGLPGDIYQTGGGETNAGPFGRPLGQSLRQRRE